MSQTVMLVSVLCYRALGLGTIYIKYNRNITSLNSEHDDDKDQQEVTDNSQQYSNASASEATASLLIHDRDITRHKYSTSLNTDQSHTI